MWVSAAGATLADRATAGRLFELFQFVFQFVSVCKTGSR
jgi:hypothetical protein